MKKHILAGISAAFLATAMLAGNAVAGCADYGTCKTIGVTKSRLCIKLAFLCLLNGKKK